MIDASVFKAYDVRGLYPSEITEAQLPAKSRGHGETGHRIEHGRFARPSEAYQPDFHGL